MELGGARAAVAVTRQFPGPRTAGVACQHVLAACDGDTRTGSCIKHTGGYHMSGHMDNQHACEAEHLLQNTACALPAQPVHHL